MIEQLAEVPLWMFAVGAVAVVFFLMVWRQAAPGWEGVAYGHLRLEGYFGNRFFKVFKGNAVDVTNSFVGDHIEQNFRQMIIEKVDEETAKQIPQDEWKRIILIGMRQGLFIPYKDLFVVVLPKDDDPAGFPGDYIRLEDKSRFSFSTLDWRNPGLIDGDICTIPQPYELRGLSKFYVHVFFPYRRGESSYQAPDMAVLQGIADRAVFDKRTVEEHQRVKAIERVDRERKSYVGELGDGMAAYAIDADGHEVASKGLRRYGQEMSPLKGRGRFGVLEFIAIIVGVAVGGAGARYFEADPIIGAIVASVVALGAVLWWKGR